MKSSRKKSAGTKQVLENGKPGYEKHDEFNQAMVGSLAGHFKEIIKTLGEDPKRDGLVNTPDRAARALQFLTHGYDLDPEAILQSAMFREKHNQMVIVKDIELYSLCEHFLQGL